MGSCINISEHCFVCVFCCELRDRWLAFHQANIQVVKEPAWLEQQITFALTERARLTSSAYSLWPYGGFRSALFISGTNSRKVMGIILPKRPDEEIEEQQSLPALTFYCVCI